METINLRLKEVRKYVKLNQTEFARELGISRAHISNMENGNDKPSSTLLRLISLQYDISLDWLQTGEGQMVYFDPEFGAAIRDMSKVKFTELIELLADKPVRAQDAVDEILDSIIRSLGLPHKSDATLTASLETLSGTLHDTEELIVERYAKADFSDSDTLIKLEGIEELYLEKLKSNAHELRELYLSNINE